MNAHTWNQIISSFPDAHILQTWQWGEVKSLYGWEPMTRVWGDETRPEAAALILERKIPIIGLSARLRILYLPKGPLLRDWGDLSLVQRVMGDLAAFARGRGAIFIKMDPDVSLGAGISGDTSAEMDPVGTSVLKALSEYGWRFSDEQIQFRNTVLIDLNSSEDDLLSQMKQKTRYNIRLAGRKGVVVRPGTPQDLDTLYELYAETSLRDGFVIRDEGYYHTLWQTFMGSKGPTPEVPYQPVCEPLIAEVNGEAVAAVVIFRFAGKAYYMHGMSSLHNRNLMPNYLLQWEAMCRAKRNGCSSYDLWGAPEVFDDRDSMWGVFRFKQGLGGEVNRTIGAYDLPLRPVYYGLYTRTLPWILHVMRKWGVSRTRRTHPRLS